MLPAPVSFSQRRTGASGGLLTIAPASRRGLLFFLRAPARFSNLFVLVLAGLACASTLISINLWSSSSSRTNLSASGVTGLPPSIANTFTRATNVRALSRLVLVPGHGVWMGSTGGEVLDEDRWLLAEYQRNRGRPATLFSHIKKAAEIAAQDASALLVFSGGQTTPAPTTEAESYARLALAGNVFTHYSADNNSSVFHFTTELYALDSFQNLLFGIARFREYTGHFPRQIVVVGYSFKSRRFKELHARALKWPDDAFEYVGIPLEDVMDESNAAEGESMNAFMPYEKDLYGCRPPLLDKRTSRNVAMRSHAYHIAAPELMGLLEWCPPGGTEVYPGVLPWSK